MREFEIFYCVLRVELRAMRSVTVNGALDFGALNSAVAI